MAEITVELQASLVVRFRCTVLLLFEATAEALHLTLSTLSLDPEAVTEVRQHFMRLSQLAEVLDQVGWGAVRGSGDVEIEASPEVLHDALLGSLLDAGEALATDIQGEAEGVRRLAEDVVSLDRILKHVDRHL
jgi:hypothetical protein